MATKSNLELAQQAVKLGYVKSVDEYLGAEEQGKLGAKNGYDSKTSSSGKMTVTARTAPKNIDQATDQINQNQQSDYNTKAKENEPKTRNSTKTYDQIFDDVLSSVKKQLPDAPEQISLADTYVKLRWSQGITELETSLNDLQAQARDLQAISRARTTAEKGKAVPLNVIAGRISEEEAQDNERLQVINDSIKTISGQLETKYNIVDSIMKYKGTDYANAVDAYDKKFSQTLSLMNTARGIAQDEKSKEDDIQDSARANLQIIYNNLSSGGVDPTSIDEAQKANITKLELQAGLPVGFYANIVNKNPKADILSTTTREDGGKKYADVITRGPDGKISTQSIYLGGSANESSGKATEGDLKRSAISAMGKDLSAVTGADGLVSPQDYKDARKQWVNGSGYTAKEFDEAFKSYIKPEYYFELGIKSDW